ncbi:MAG: hypothetical protein RL885_06790 [Planctomycetota bacterium]
MGKIFREEDGTPRLAHEREIASRWTKLPDGWLVSSPNEWIFHRVDVDTFEDLGPVPERLQEHRILNRANYFAPLSIHLAWIQPYPIPEDPAPAGWLVDMDTGDEDRLQSPGKVLVAADTERLLVLASDGSGLIQWTPETGRIEPVIWNREVGDLSEVMFQRQTVIPKAARRTVSGKMALHLVVEPDTAIALYDPADGSAKVMTPWKPSRFYDPVCVTETDALWCIEEGRRLVRFENGERKVFFPREDS